MSRAGKLMEQCGVTSSKNEAALDSNVIDGITYYNTTVGQTEYTFYQNKALYGTEWAVISKRKNMRTAGQTRFFKDLKALEAKVKGLRGISNLIDESLLSEEALTGDGDGYNAALTLLVRLIQSRGFTKASKALEKELKFELNDPIEPAELEDYFAEFNDHALSLMATAIKRKKPEWVLLALIEVGNTTEKLGETPPALDRLRLAMTTLDSLKKRHAPTLDSIKVDKHTTAIIKTLPSEFQNELTVDWKMEF
jgi:hypothetical protein